jgi:hypothetical protein
LDCAFYDGRQRVLRFAGRCHVHRFYLLIARCAQSSDVYQCLRTLVAELNSLENLRAPQLDGVLFWRLKIWPLLVRLYRAFRSDSEVAWIGTVKPVAASRRKRSRSVTCVSWPANSPPSFGRTNTFGSSEQSASSSKEGGGSDKHHRRTIGIAAHHRRQRRGRAILDVTPGPAIIDARRETEAGPRRIRGLAVTNPRIRV